VILGFLFIIAVAMFVRSKKRKSRFRTTKKPLIRAPRTASYPYYLATCILSPCETRFYEVLRTVIPEGVLLTIKTRMADVLVCPSASWESHGWKVSNRHFDFVLLDGKTLRPLLAVELDDSSHDTKSGKARDRFVDAASAACGLVVLHVRASAAYDAQALGNALRGAL
jgi:hypothetical protein